MKKLFATLLCCGAFSLVGCIDRDFNIADTSGEITLGGEELVIPLADISEISLGDLLGDNDFLQEGEKGIYQISFSSFGEDPTKFEKIAVDGIAIPNITGLSPKLEPISFSFGSLPTSLLFSAIEKPVALDIPTTIGNIMKIEAVKINTPIKFPLPNQISGLGTIDDRTLTLLEMMQMATISTSGTSELVFDAELEILEQLQKVDWVEFGCEEHPYGAPFDLKFDMKGLSGVVGGGTLTLNVRFPDGYYLRDENGVDMPTETHNIFSKEITISAKQKEVLAKVYLHKIDYSDHTFTGGKLKIDDHITYSYAISVNLGKGDYNLNSEPMLVVEAAPQYKDVEVKINHFEIPKQEYAITHSFNGMPGGVKVEKIAFKESSTLNVSLKGLEWCVVKDNISGDDISPKIEIDMPLCMRFREHPLLDESTNVLLASTAELAQGITLSLDHIDCKNSEGIKQENGQLLIDEKIGASIHMESLDGHTVLVSTITPPENFEIVMGIAESRLEIDAANSVVTWSDDTSFDFDLKDNVPFIAQSVDVPEMIAEVKRIDIGKADSDEPLSMQFKLDAGNQFPVEELELNVAVNLGKMLRPTQKMFDKGLVVKNENGDNIISINESWHPKQSALVKTLEFDALENIPAVTDGKITINQTFPVTGSVKIKSGEQIILSDRSDVKVDIDFNIDDIEVRSFTGKVDINLQPESMMVDLGLDQIEGFNIGSLNLNPVLTLRLKDNPTGVGLNANVDIKTYDKENKQLSALKISPITVNESGASTIVISTSRNREKYEVEGVNFIAVDNLSQLLKNLPSKIGVDMQVASNKDKEITIDLKKAKQGYEIEYQYEVLLPFEFEGDVELSYETTIFGLNPTFASLADATNGFKVGDVGLVAEFGSTIPFNIVLSAELVNANGTTEGVEANLNINDCVIKGCDPATGEKSISRVDLDFDLGDSHSLAGLKSADGVRLKFTLYNAGEESSLSKSQALDGKLKLRVRDGLTIDVFDLLKGGEE